MPRDIMVWPLVVKNNIKMQSSICKLVYQKAEQILIQCAIWRDPTPNTQLKLLYLDLVALLAHS